MQESRSGQRWDVAEDGTGHLYFYTADGDSVWELPLTLRDNSFLAGNNCHQRYYILTRHTGKTVLVSSEEWSRGARA